MKKNLIKNKTTKFVLKILTILLVLIGLISISVYLIKQERKEIESIINVNSDNLIEVVQEQINKINALETKMNELETENNDLQQKNEELVQEIEKLKVSKTEKVQVTSRGSTTSRSSTSNNDEWITATVTAYCPCSKCCGKLTGITASGTKATAGRTIAASSNYAFGTQIEIQGYGVFTVEDRGGAIKGNKIDMFFNTHQEALNFGKKTLLIRVVK